MSSFKTASQHITSGQKSPSTCRKTLKVCLNVGEESEGNIQFTNPPTRNSRGNWWSECTSTLHGGVGLTMAAVREDYWVPKLRRLVKSIRTDCWGCQRSRATAFVAPPGELPKDQTTGETAFEVMGTDFAGPCLKRLIA